jgi:hypothetical protein
MKPVRDRDEIDGIRRLHAFFRSGLVNPDRWELLDEFCRHTGIWLNRGDVPEATDEMSCDNSRSCPQVHRAVPAIVFNFCEDASIKFSRIIGSIALELIGAMAAISKASRESEIWYLADTHCGKHCTDQS